MNPVPSVSVVMPVWRADPGQIRSAVESVLSQTLAALELIVIEDPSDRVAEDLIQSIGDSRIVYRRNRERTSIVQQHNQGVDLARAELVARADSDDCSEPARLEQQRRMLDDHPEVDVVGSNLLVIDESGTPLGRRIYPASHEDILRQFPRLNPIANPAVMFRRSVVQRFGGWTEGRNATARDYEWYSRLARGGARFANIQTELVRYRLHRGSIKTRRTRATLETTIEVKRSYWLSQMSSADRTIYFAERLLAHTPPSLVRLAFRAVRLRRP